MARLALLAALVLPAVSGQSSLVGYFFGTDVTEHSELDLDQQAIEALLANGDFGGAANIYENGQNSLKSNGSLRTIQGFSTGAGSNLAAEQLYNLYRGYWGSDTYADDLVQEALTGAGPYAGGVPSIARDEVAHKTMVYQNVWMYVVHELEDAVTDCEGENLNDNEDTGVQAWDEGWAFYAGSLAATVSGDEGLFPYALAEKRCQNFQTCVGDGDGDAASGTSLVNAKLRALYNEGQAALVEGNCQGAADVIRRVVPQMTLPLVQGMLRYAYLADPNGDVSGDADTEAKEQAEAWAFTAAVLPQLDACNPSAAATIRSNMEFGATSPVADGYATIYSLVHDMLPCLSVSCAELGGLQLPGATAFVVDAAPCADAEPAAAVGPVAGPTFGVLAGYAFGTDVTEHSELDLDQQAIEERLAAEDFEGARTLYTDGSFSTKGDGFMRTIQGFSTGAGSNLAAEQLYNLYRGYWGSDTYADDLVQEALTGAGPYAGEEVPSIARDEVAHKTMAYQNVWMYVVHELEDAVADCDGGNLNDNEDTSVHAWDEGWAFYAGSLEGQEGTGSGVFPYALAEKRCANFFTCAGDSDGDDGAGTSLVNSKLQDLYHQGKAALAGLRCNDARVVLRAIVPQMTLPLVQGMLRYAYLADPNGDVSGDTDTEAKEQAEAWAFTAAALPQLAACDAGAAAEIRANLEWGTDPFVGSGYQRVYGLVHGMLPCLQVSCSELGGLVDSVTDGVPTFFAGAEPCTDATPLNAVGPAAGSGFGVLAGYAPVSDVSQRARIDLDQQAMEAALDAMDYESAISIYTTGRFSTKSNGTLRTIQGFSTEAGAKLAGEDLYDIYRAYWNSDTYADDFVREGLEGTGRLAEAGDVAREEIAKKGAAYQNTWMYVVHELEDAVNDCRNNDLGDNDGGAQAWDEGWVFYAGTLEGQDGSGSGVQPYALAEKRCANFFTCTGDMDGAANAGMAQANANLLSLFAQGQNALANGNCEAAASLIRDIVPQMTLPLLQGTLRYAYLADPNAGDEQPPQKQQAEGWAFAAALLPQLDVCDSTVAATVRTNFEFSTSGTPIVDGYEALVTALQGTYACLGLTCADVGGYAEEVSSEGVPMYISGMEPCTDAAPTTSVGPQTGTTNPITSMGGLVGYAPATDVTEHSEIDLDQRAIDIALDAGDFPTATSVYTDGQNSAKNSSVFRTIRGFSTEAADKMATEDLYNLYRGFWSSDTYADDLVQEGLRGSGDFEGAEVVARAEMAMKTAAYQNTWMYVVHEMEDAIMDCENGNIADNDASVHAWDEAWAFYAGSLETAAGGSGFGVYTLADKRCANFGTCVADADGTANAGMSAVNARLLVLFQQGQEALTVGNCQGAAVALRAIVPQMTVPLVQGMLRYAYLADPSGGNETPAAKPRAEGWAFTAAVLPQLDACDATDAAEIRSNMAFSAGTPVSGGYARVFQLAQRMYSCLGFTCADVGGLLGDAGFITGAEPCIDTAPATSVGPQSATAATTVGLVGYLPQTDVDEHSEIDMDQMAIDNALDAGEFPAAAAVYAVGENSQKTGGVLRNIRGFSTEAASKMGSEDLYNLYRSYWNSDTYADDLVQQGLEGSGDFENADAVARAEIASKTAAYQNTWMYVVHEMEDAIADCEGGNLANNDAGVHAWDEAWAFYSGSLETGNGEAAGFGVYTLADKRCENFGTCVADADGDATSGTSAVNARLLALFQQGQQALNVANCQGAAVALRAIVPQMTVPLVQGMLRYAYNADPAGGNEIPAAKPRAEGWAFTAAVLPQLDACDANAAASIRDNMAFSAGNPVASGYAAVFDMVQAMYPCLGFTCADVGGIVNGAGFIAGAEPCLDAKPSVAVGPVTSDDRSGDSGGDGDSGMGDGAVAGLSIAMLLIGLLIGACVACVYGRKREHSYMKHTEKNVYDAEMARTSVSGDDGL